MKKVLTAAVILLIIISTLFSQNLEYKYDLALCKFNYAKSALEDLNTNYAVQSSNSLSALNSKLSDFEKSKQTYTSSNSPQDRTNFFQSGLTFNNELSSTLFFIKNQFAQELEKSNEKEEFLDDITNLQEDINEEYTLCIYSTLNKTIPIELEKFETFRQNAESLMTKMEQDDYDTLDLEEVVDDIEEYVDELEDAYEDQDEDIESIRQDTWNKFMYSWVEFNSLRLKMQIQRLQELQIQDNNLILATQLLDKNLEIDDENFDKSLFETSKSDLISAQDLVKKVIQK